MNVFPLQEGGQNRSAHGADTACMFPAPEFICPDAAAGIRGTCFRSPTAAHRGSPYFSNSRVLDFFEINECIAFELLRAIESGTGQFWLKCADKKIGDPVSFSEPGCMQQFKIPEECQIPDCCVGWDMLQLEILDMPEVPEDDKCGDDCLGKLHKLAFMASVMGKNPCTGK